jgi:hypothetical protein
VANYPTPEKTWTVTEIIASTTGSRVGDIKQLTFLIKEAMKSLGWTVAGSNNNTVAGMDAVDRIAAYTDFTNSGNDGDTWIVMENPNWGGGQFRLSMNNGGSFGILVHTQVSVGGNFTGGTTTTLPTAIDGDDDINNELFDFNFPGGGATVTAYILTSSDLQHTRIIMCSNGEPSGALFFETAGGAKGIWDGRFYGRAPTFIRGDSPQLGLNATIVNGNRKFMKMKNPNSNTFGFLYFTHPVSGGYQIFQPQVLTTPNEISGEYPHWSLGLFNFDMAGCRGEVGYVKDWWFSVFAAQKGSSFPDDDSLDFMFFSAALLMPWDGATVPNFGS